MTVTVQHTNGHQHRGGHASQSRIFVVDDHALMRNVLATYIKRQDDLSVCGEAASGKEVLMIIGQLGCDLALLDVSMPGMSGIEVVQYLREHHPEVKCLMLSGHGEQVYVEEAKRAGAEGYVMKGNPTAILEAIRRVLEGQQYVSDEIREYWRA